MPTWAAVALASAIAQDTAKSAAVADGPDRGLLARGAHGDPRATRRFMAGFVVQTGITMAILCSKRRDDERGPSLREDAPGACSVGRESPSSPSAPPLEPLSILEHMGLPTTAPTLAPARSPPELEFAPGRARGLLLQGPGLLSFLAARLCALRVSAVRSGYRRSPRRVTSLGRKPRRWLPNPKGLGA